MKMKWQCGINNVNGVIFIESLAAGEMAAQSTARQLII